MLGQLRTDEYGLSASSVGGRKASPVEAESKEKSCKIHHFFLQNLGVKSTGFLKKAFVQSLFKLHLKLKHNQKLRKHSLSKHDNIWFYPTLLCLSLPPVARTKVMRGSKGGKVNKTKTEKNQPVLPPTESPPREKSAMNRTDYNSQHSLRMLLRQILSRNILNNLKLKASPSGCWKL